MKFPKPLKKGSTVAVTAPSFGCTIEPYISRFKEAVRLLKEHGYNLVIGDTVFKNDGIGISTSPFVAAKELMDFYLDPKIDAVISAGGGELMCETISYVDFSSIKNASAKWFLGYSDNTNFIFPLVTLCNVPAVYGHCITGFGKPWEQSEIDTLSLLEGKTSSVRGYPLFQLPEDGTEAKKANPLSPYVLTQKKHLRSYVCKEEKLIQAGAAEEINFEGMLLGGCLDVLNNIAGTRFDGVKSFIKNSSKKIIWVLESCDLSPLDIRRSLWHLKECGWFENSSGFIIGRPLSSFSGEIMGVNKYNAVTDILGSFGLPVVMDADVGHVPPSMPLVMGTCSRVKVKGDDIRIDMDFS